MKNCLIVFAKEPLKGRVKTRLGEHYTEEECVDLYKSFLHFTIELTHKITCDKKILAYDSEGEPDFLRQIAAGFEFYEQKGAKLGEKMYNAIEYAYRSGASNVIIIGSDSPTLPSDFVDKAFAALDLYDVVIGPCRDGGYYLIGMKEPCPGIFEGIKWSTETVLRDTLLNVKRLDKKYMILEEWYDIDKPEDVAFFEKESGHDANK